MSVASFKFEILVGPVTPLPVSADFVQALTRIKVVRGDSAPSGFQFSLKTQYTSVPGVRAFITRRLVHQFNRVLILVDDGLDVSVLMDGYITRFDLSDDAQELDVFGEDVSAKMNLIQISTSYPESPDGAIVTQILARYAAIGITPEIVPPEVLEVPTETVPQQLVTDLVYLNFLAERNNSRFYIKPGPVPGQNTAYWGPRELLSTTQSALTAPGVASSNVNRMAPSFTATKRQLTYTERLSEGPEGAESADLPADATRYSQLRKLALSQPPLTEFSTIALEPDSFGELLQVIEVSGRLAKDERLTLAQTRESAQSSTDRSSGRSLQVKGELDAVVYGHVLEAPGYVVVRGLGQSFDGNFYVESVTHDIRLSGESTSYKQSFELVREGLDTTTETTLA